MLPGCRGGDLSVQRILGIDPGLTATGYALIESDGDAVRLITSGVVVPPNGQTLPARLGVIFDSLSAVIKSHRPTEASVENVFVHKDASAALKLGQARGAAVCANVVHGVAVYEYAARAVKKTIVGKGNASKQQVQFMVTRLLRLADSRADPRRNDETDAMALALCHVFTHGAKTRLERAVP